MIIIIDYGRGNLRSVQKAFEYVGLESKVSSDQNDLKEAVGLVLPGVGSFGDAMINLEKSGLISIIKEKISAGNPFLGICLGYQVLFSRSYEEGINKGLNIFKGEVIRLPSEVKVPHMGWNDLQIVSGSPIFQDISGGEFFYFVHSYIVKPEDEGIVSSWTNYGIRFASSVWKDNIYGIQFHPEKSSRRGLKILERFGVICNDYISGS